MILKTKAELEPIKERERKATKGPWFKTDTLYEDEIGILGGKNASVVREVNDDGELVTVDVWDEASNMDLEFIAHSREDIPNLIETVEALMEEVKWLREWQRQILIKEPGIRE